MAALFLAGGERASAVVRWLRLPQAKRRTGDGLDDKLVQLLSELKDRRDESYLVAARLAARLGLEKAFAMDDHTADHAVADRAAWVGAIRNAWKNAATKTRGAAGESLEAGLGSNDGVLALYRGHNAPQEMHMAFEADFGAVLEEPSPQRFGLQYLGA